MNKTTALLVTAVLWVAAIGDVSAQNSCTVPTNVRVGYFNGVMTDWNYADKTQELHLEKIYGSTAPNGASLTYELYYNTTQGFGDFVETLDQRLREQHKIFWDKYYLFYEALNGGGDYIDAIENSIPEFKGFADGMLQYVLAKVPAAIGDAARLVGDINNIEPSTFAVHARQIDEVLRVGERFLLVAHSQGNLFANRAYKYYTSKASPSTVQVIHIAPASPEVKGPWTLAYQDFVINALRLVGSVPDNTTFIPDYMFRPRGLNGEPDLLGHGLLEIYLNPALATRTRIDEQMQSAIEVLSNKDDFASSSGPCIKITRVSCEPLAYEENTIFDKQWILEGAAKSNLRFAIIQPFVFDGTYNSKVDSVVMSKSFSVCLGGGWSDYMFFSGTSGPGSSLSWCARETGSPIETRWVGAAYSRRGQQNIAVGVRLGQALGMYWPQSYWNTEYWPHMYMPGSFSSVLRDMSTLSCPGTYTFQ